MAEEHIPRPRAPAPPRTASSGGTPKRELSLSLSDTPTQTVPAQRIAMFEPVRQNSYHAPRTADPKSPDPRDSDPAALTPLRAHYLKRELVTQQFANELEILSTPDALSLLGPPFLPKDKFINGVPVDKANSAAALQQQRRPRPPDDDDVELPFLRYFFNHFVLSFPFLANSPPTFFSHKLQPFIHSFFVRNITGTDDREEETNRRRLAGKVEKHLGLVMAAAIKLSDNGGREEVVRVALPGMDAPDSAPNDDDAFVATPTDERPMAMAAIAGQAGTGPPPISQQPPQASTAQGQAGPSDGTGPPPPHPVPVGFEVNVVSVRSIRTKSHLRHKVHEEFVIRTRCRGWDDVFVSRRYGDFVKLAETLRTEFPEADIRAPPAKDRRSVTAHGGSSGTNSPAPGGSTPGASTPTTGSTDNLPNAAGALAPIQLARERNRLTLRGYLHRLLRKADVADSNTLRSFLLSSPVTLSPDEIRDVEQREMMDREREREMQRFRKEVEGRVSELEGYIRGFREELVKSDGLSRVFGTVRETEKIEDLPIEYRKVIEWARISLASTIYQLFLGSDNSSSAFAQLKRMHGLMPYWAMRGVLRISNPVAMIRGVLDLFLARPFGAASLLQRMFSSGLYEEVREYHADAAKVASKIADEKMCQRVKDFVAAPKEIQEVYEADAKSEKVDIMSIILRSAEGPAFDRAAMQRILRAAPEYEKYKSYRDALEDPAENMGPANDDAWLFEDLHVYMRLLKRARDKEQMIELIFEGTTSELLKDIVTIFYSPLMQVYRAANIADSLYDLQKFLDDLIKTVERAEEFAFGDPQRIVQTFVDLVGRHEAAFYHFVHQVHSKGAGLFDGLMHWIELFVNFVREGLTNTVSLEVLLPHAGKEREAILAEVDEIIEYHRKLKVAHHERMLRRVARGERPEPGQMAPDEDAAFVQGVMSNLHLAKVVGDVDDIANAEEQSDEEEEEEDDFDDAVTDIGSQPSGSPPPHQPEHPKDLTHRGPSPRQKKKKDRVTIEPPELVHIPQLTPIFTEVVKQLLQQPPQHLAPTQSRSSVHR